MPQWSAISVLELWRDTTPEIAGEGGVTARVLFSLTKLVVCRYKAPDFEL